MTLDEPGSLGERQQARRPTNRLITILLVVITVAGIALIGAESDQIMKTIQQVDWHPLPAALLLTLIAYGCMAYSFAVVGRLLGIEMSVRDLSLIGYVTNAINHVVTTGGLAGNSLRYLLMKRHGASLRDVIAVTIIHYALTSLDMLLVFPFAVAYLLRQAQVSPGVAMALWAVTAVVILLVLLVGLLIFNHHWRHRFLDLLDHLVRRINRPGWGEQLEQLDDTMSRGVEALRQSPKAWVLVPVLTWLDWIGSVLVLYCCLDAFGPLVSFGDTVAGFVLGIMAGVLSMIPGGLGIQEGSMTGVFTLLGVPFGQAFLAAILFRIIFLFLPYLVSIGFSRWLLATSPATDPAASD